MSDMIRPLISFRADPSRIPFAIPGARMLAGADETAMRRCLIFWGGYHHGNCGRSANRPFWAAVRGDAPADEGDTKTSELIAACQNANR
jgi:hypothetical protein